MAKTRFIGRAGVALTAALAASPALAFDAHYTLTISTAQTAHVAFKNGVFKATGLGAVLNVNDLENALSTGPVEVWTGNGYGGQNGGDIRIEAGFGWSSANALTLDAYHSVIVDQPVANTGTGATTIVTNDKGTGGVFTFGSSGNLTIANLSNTLTIDRSSYTLENDVASLAAAIANNDKGYFALANSYDASVDGIYKTAPIPAFFGVLEGLGNTISNLSISDCCDVEVGFITNAGSTIADFNLANVSVLLRQLGVVVVGALVADEEYGTIRNCHATGAVRQSSRYYAANNYVGGLVGDSGGAIVGSSWSGSVVSNAPGAYVGGLVGFFSSSYGISYSSAGGSVSGGTDAIVGGLAGDIETSLTLKENFATASVSVGKWDGFTKTPASAGGLIGFAEANVSNSYAEGNVTGGPHAVIGGTFGLIQRGDPTRIYSVGTISRGSDGIAGGFEGWAHFARPKAAYWDTTTAGISKGVGKGNAGNVRGLTTTELQSGLPKGFNPKIWAQNPGVNNGFPYLIDNPPQ